MPDRILTRWRHIRSLFRVICLGVCLMNVQAQALEFRTSDPLAVDDDFLPVDEAFVFSHEVVDGDTLLVRWEMPDGYYLYRHRLKFSTRAATSTPGSPVPANSESLIGEPQIPDGKRKVDEYEGDVEVYYHQLVVTLPLRGDLRGQEVGVGYQGCADAGLCYPPETRWLSLGDSAATPAPESASLTPATALPQSAIADGAVAATGGPATADQAFVALLEDSNLWTILLLFLVAGVGLAFTPCVLPMVPILSSIIVGEGASLSRRRAFSLSLAYVLGMAVTYAVIGTLVGFFGAELNLQARLQSPPVLIFFALVFVLLSLAMFGFYELALPASWQDRLQRLSPGNGGGKHLSVVVMGAVSSLVVSPCVSAPLAGALVFISQTGNAVLGGSALLALGLGMGLPLLVVGAGGGHFLPRAGAWMDVVKAVFGVLLLGVAVWLIERLVAPEVTLLLWAILLIGSGVFLGGLDTEARAGWGRLWKAVGFIGVVYGVILIIGAASGAKDPLRPLAPLAASVDAPVAAPGSALEHDWRAVDDLAGLRREITAAKGQLVILDLYADWCISCKVMERRVFPAPDVAPLLARFTKTRVDMTDNTAGHQAMLDTFGLFGPPSLVFFDGAGNELTALRIQGEIDAAGLAAHLRNVLTRHGGAQPAPPSV